MGDRRRIAGRLPASRVAARPARVVRHHVPRQTGDTHPRSREAPRALPPAPCRPDWFPRPRPVLEEAAGALLAATVAFLVALGLGYVRTPAGARVTLVVAAALLMSAVSILVYSRKGRIRYLFESLLAAVVVWSLVTTSQPVRAAAAIGVLSFAVGFAVAGSDIATAIRRRTQSPGCVMRPGTDLLLWRANSTGSWSRPKAAATTL
jgi:hypothetical protein